MATAQRIKQTLNAVGKKTFVDCFEGRARQNRERLSKYRVDELCQPESDGWKPNVLTSKTSHLNQIFREGWQCDALYICCNAKKIPHETVQKAKHLVQEILCITLR